MVEVTFAPAEQKRLGKGASSGRFLLRPVVVTVLILQRERAPVVACLGGELARPLVAPVLLLILFGVLQFGIVFKDYLALTDAVRAGARQATVSRQKADPVGE